MKHQRGFSTLEVIVALAISLGVGLAALALIVQLTHGVADAASSRASTLAIETLEGSLRSEAQSAFAVFVPAKDVFGDADADGHEVDFYTKSDTGRDEFWAYRYDAAKSTVQRYDYATPAGGATAVTVGVRDRTTGNVDSAQRYPSMSGITHFAAASLEAEQAVGAKSDAYGRVAASVLNGTVHPEPVSFNNATLDRPDLYGGNVAVGLDLANAHGAGHVQLVAGTMPNGFTVEGKPEFHAVVYRRDHTEGGSTWFSHQSYVKIYGRVDVSYDHWATSQVWCDYIIHGKDDNGGKGMGGHDPYADYQPDSWSESTAGVLDACQHQDGEAAPPARGYNNATTPPDPNVSNTAPPCFALGQCWPDDAPVDFNYSPAPVTSPPPTWCAKHYESPLCGDTTPPPLAGGNPQPEPTDAPTLAPPPIPTPTITPCDIEDPTSCHKGKGPIAL